MLEWLPKRKVAVLCFLVALLFQAVSSVAQTYSTSQIIVNGQPYVLSFHDGSFDDVNVLFDGSFLEGQPWWNSPSLSDPDTGPDTFRDAFDTAWNSFVNEGLLAGQTQYIFARFFRDRTEPGDELDVGTSRIRVPGAVTTDPADRSSVGGYLPRTARFQTVGVTYNNVYIGAQAVPEINGNLLAQITLILGTAMLWLRSRGRSNAHSKA